MSNNNNSSIDLFYTIGGKPCPGLPESIFPAWLLPYLSGLGIFETEYGDGRVFSNSFWSELGWNPNDFDGEAWLDLVHPDDRFRVQRIWDDVVGGSVDLVRYTFRIRGRDGLYHWANSAGRAVTRTRGGELRRFVGLDVDVTSTMSELLEVRAERDGLRQQLLLEAAIRQAGTIMRTELAWTDAAEVILQQLRMVIVAPHLLLVRVRGRSLDVAGNRREYWPEGNPRGAPRRPALLRLYRRLRTHSPVATGDLSAIGQEELSEIGWLSGSLLAALVVGDEGTGAMIICHDPRRDAFARGDQQTVVIFADQVAVALRNAQQFEEQQRLATVDSLTSLQNRRSFQREATAVLQQDRSSGRCAVIMLDVDNFKSVNDRFGHDHGDLVLKRVADAAKSVLRPQDLMGRWGGEEFAVLLTGVSEKAAVGIAERMRSAVANRVLRPDGSPVTVSLGVSLCDGQPELEPLLRTADRSLYQAKALGRNRVCVEACMDREFIEAAADGSE